METHIYFLVDTFTIQPPFLRPREHRGKEGGRLRVFWEVRIFYTWQRNCICEISTTWLLQQDLNNDNTWWHAKEDGGNLMGSQMKSCRQLMTPERGKSNLLQILSSKWLFNTVASPKSLYIQTTLNRLNRFYLNLLKYTCHNNNKRK